MGDPLRFQVPGGALTPASVLALVGWAGAAGCASLRWGDSQDGYLDADRDPGPAPAGIRRADRGSLQSSAYGEAPDPAVPWLTRGTWLDLLAQVGDTGNLDVQLVHPGAAGDFVRHGHLRFEAQKATHRWTLSVRRPGSPHLLLKETVDTGSVAQTIATAQAAWDRGADAFWAGRFEVPDRRLPVRPWEGFREEGGGSFSFGLWSPGGRMRLERLRSLAWKASQTGGGRLWLTPGGVVVVPSLDKATKAGWESWAAEARLVTLHGELEHRVRAAAGAEAARDEVVCHLRTEDQLPPGGMLLVADMDLNRTEGVGAAPWPLVIRTATGWLYRTGDGRDAGEGTLAEVLGALGTPPRWGQTETPAPDPGTPAAPAAHRCSSCLTVYDPVYGDPGAGIAPGVGWEDLPATWSCPVCGGPAADFARV
ncbi:MAG TPA: rubredoxin [Spirochaetia bacterium]|jgi:rubredoxin|nr:rubredoxin [Spirochaetia bacterium]